MISRFFIDRPIFAAVVSIVITLAGAISLKWLPIAQYPEITPPSVQVSISYPGASSQVVADTVGAPIEQQVNGVPGMLYMSSQSGNDGSYALSVTFEVGTDLNTALVMVQNRVALAMPQLPTSVQMQGVTIRKKTPDILNVINFYSPDGRYDDIYLSNYVTVNIRDELLRVDGVSDINYLGQRDYSIRVWLDPQKLSSSNMTPIDVAAAIRSQNVEVAGGQVGQGPAAAGPALQLPVSTLGRLAQPEQFDNLIVKVGPIGMAVSPSIAAVQPRAAAASGMAALSGPGKSGFGRLSLPGLKSFSGMTSLTAPPSLQSSSSSTTASSSSTQGSSTTPADVTALGGLAGGATGVLAQPDLSQYNILTQPMSTAQPGTSVQVVQPAHASQVGPQAQSSSLVRLRDVARVEMGAQNYNISCTFDGRPTVGLAIHQLPGTNALDVGERVRQKMDELKSRFPVGVDYEIAYDTTPFIRESVGDVVQTLFEAVAIVALVVLLFLQNWRAALIPLIAVPVAIIGTFAAMAALRFSLNNISLFGLVLAIGIVVDDAIVVVENVERWLEHGLEPRAAARKAMDEVTGPVVAVALVLCAVFVPCAFISGITGRFFRQFAVTIAVSTVFSAINSLTLSPALAAILLRPRGARRDPLTWLIDLVLGWPFRLFNVAFGAGTTGYVWAVGRLLHVRVLVLAAYGGLLVLTYFVFTRAPTGFVPQQDQGRLMVNVELPPSASLQRSQAALAQVDEITRKTPGVAHTVTISGLSFLQGTNSSNFGSMFVILDPFDKRKDPSLRDEAIMARLRKEFTRKVKDAQVTVFGAPPIPGLSVASGFKLMVEDRADLGPQVLQQQTDTLVGKLRDEPGLVGVFTQFRSNTPQLYMEIDRTKAASQGVSLLDINQVLQMYLGSLYVNSFNEFGRYWQVTMQAEGKYRNKVTDINLLQVRNSQGEMVPLGTLARVYNVNGPVMITRYNLYRAAPVTGGLRPGVSSGPVIASADRMAQETLPRSMNTEWTELMFLQIQAGNTALNVFLLAVVFVFLALAALYESWSLPAAVILIVPLCLLCSVTGVLIAHTAVNIFVQIGLVVLVGLACKNAILIVEFAAQMHREGRPRAEATLEASRLRLRPILMTSFAFILGVVPLVLATGAGAEMRQSLGTAVFSGMLGVTLFGIFLTPVFFDVVEGLSEARLLSTVKARWAVSGLIGALSGAAFGYLLTRAGITRLPWSPIVGGCVGALGGLLVPALRRAARR